MARTAYWVIDLASGSAPSAAQIAAGQNGAGSAALKSGSEAFAATSGSGTITEATTVTGLSAGVQYRLSWTIYDDVALNYATAVHGLYSVLNGGTGAFTLTGVATGLLAGRKLTADRAQFTLTGNATGLTAQRKLTADAATFTLTGNATGLAAARKLTADVASFALTGYDAGLTYSGGAAVLTAERGQFTLTGNATGLVAARKLTADATTFTLTGNDVALNYGKTLTADRGQFTLTGQDVAFGRTYVLTADPATFTLTGRDAGLTYSGAPVVETTPTKRGAGGSRFVEARKRLPMPFLIDWLTHEEPAEETKRVIREIKAGRPIPRDAKPPKGPENISAERLAPKILPYRAFQFQNYLSEIVDAQRVIEKAVQMAREQDDEDILLLL